jgi:hypothetical protein
VLTYKPLTSLTTSQTGAIERRIRKLLPTVVQEHSKVCGTGEWKLGGLEIIGVEGRVSENVIAKGDLGDFPTFEVTEH